MQCLVLPLALEPDLLGGCARTATPPMLVLRGEGELRITGGDAGDQRFQIRGGFLQVADDVVTVLSEHAS